MVNTKFIRKWIDALRSGTFNQGRGKLRSNRNRYCCLGVACELLPKKFNIKWVKEKGALLYGLDINKSETDYYRLPEEILDYIGIDNFSETQLIRMNDEEKKSFTKIADFLETNYLSKKKNDAK
jgi:hypothetical protein